MTGFGQFSAIPLVGLAALAALTVGCSTGEGSGSVKSDRLYVKDCWNGPFDLQPTFFADTPFDDTQQIRIQRGDRLVEVSDGVLFTITGVQAIRSNLDTAVNVSLPIGVRPPGFPVTVEPYPPPASTVSMSLYLNATCHVQNVATYAVSGSITFKSLFSGDRNENSADNRLTSAKFEVVVADPRDGVPSASPAGDAGVADGAVTTGAITYPADKSSTVTGDFRFFFQRGQPAQPFP